MRRSYDGIFSEPAHRITNAAKVAEETGIEKQKSGASAPLFSLETENKIAHSREEIVWTGMGKA